MATYLFLILAYALPSALDPVPMEGQQSFILLIFIVTFLVPALNIVMLKGMAHYVASANKKDSIGTTKGFISSLNFNYREERVIPFSLITVFYSIVIYIFYAKFRIGLHDHVLRLMIVLNLLVLATTVVTYFYKVSVHSLSMWGLIGIILFLNKISDNNLLLVPTAILLALTGLVMWSRLQLRAHNSNELWLGAALGFGVSFFSMSVLF